MSSVFADIKDARMYHKMLFAERRDPMMFIGVNTGRKISQVHHVGDNRVVTYFNFESKDIEDVAVLGYN